MPHETAQQHGLGGLQHLGRQGLGRQAAMLQHDAQATLLARWRLISFVKFDNEAMAM